MSTRSFIAMKVPQGFKGIYCHFDGYPSGVGATLRKYYTTSAKVRRLINLGDISSLEKEIGRKHDFDNPNPGWTIVYHRDRGELWKDVKPTITRDIFELERVARNASAEYLYIFQNGEWMTERL